MSEEDPNAFLKALQDAAAAKKTSGSSSDARPRLTVLDGRSVGRIVALSKDQMIIGRLQSQVHIVLDDTGISRKHAAIEKTPEGWFLVNLGSTNATRVDDVDVTERLELTEGCTLTIGPVHLSFSSKQDEEEAFKSTLLQAATRDWLTGVYNRGYFGDLCRKEFSRHRRSGLPLSVLLIDVDELTRINARSIEAGDEVLQMLARLCAESLAAGQSVSRWGSEEFAVLLPHTGVDGAETVAEGIRAKVQAHAFDTIAGPLEVTVSIGCVTASDEDLKDHEVVLEAAYDVLGRAKGAGRNRVASAELPEGGTNA